MAITQGKIDKIAKDLGLTKQTDINSVQYVTLPNGEVEIQIAIKSQSGFHTVHTAANAKDAFKQSLNR